MADIAEEGADARVVGGAGYLALAKLGPRRGEPPRLLHVLRPFADHTLAARGVPRP